MFVWPWPYRGVVVELCGYHEVCLNVDVGAGTEENKSYRRKIVKRWREESLKS